MINVPTLASLRRAQSGFTLVEVLVASFVLMVGAMSAFALLDRANGATNRVRTSDNATNLARELIEGARSVPYEKVSSPGVIAELQALPGLQDIDGGAYTIRRNGTTYSVGIDVCIMDDPKDGGGPRPTTATFCANSAPIGTADKNPEDYKRITVSVSWTEQGRTRVSKQTGLINNPGSASGPAIRSLTPVGYTAPFVVTTDVNAVTWDVTTSSKPATIGWLLDGTRQTGAVTQNGPTGLAWRFDWNMKTLDDGAYVIAAEASDVYGVSGPGRQETIVLNRFVPRAPKQVTGGRTGFGTVELEWTANSERDVVGYQVFRVGAPTPVCEITTQKLDTFCTDTSPPSDATLEYYVRYYDKDTSGNLRASADSTHLLVTKDNTAPFEVTGLTLQTLASGDTKLTWSRAVPEDPDAGDSVSFFRIYRDGTALGDRYERYFDGNGTPSVTWTDTGTGGTTHSYWVTAVDQQYRESPFVGPVTG
ncbi:MAG: prepilin-type N-terminal cleavage/methylation domain-containing protein [Solirubrobacteraceae bacterium]